jgi:hypothetical protein
MSTWKIRCALAALLFISTSAAAQAVPPTLALQHVATVPGAVFLTSPPGDARQFIVQRDGRIFVRQNGVVLPTPFLDINETVLSQKEGGLLSMAFHPDYASNGYFFLFYTDKLHRTVIERRRVSADPNLAEPGSSLTILRIPKINMTHNGGQLAFGPDGYLYLATGDDGGGGDRFRNGQDTTTLLAKVLRIDVSHARRSERYRVPATNPFLGVDGVREEIWAYGLRNPWRFSFDDGLLYLGDVGQDEREEVNVVDVDWGGYNFGWNIMEGTQCYEDDGCDRSGLTLPALDYGHDQGCSVTGGYVYRGSALPELAGHYFYSDFCSGFLRSFRYENGSAAAHTTWPVGRAGNILSFGRDGDGELYLLAIDGRILKLVRAPAGQAVNTLMPRAFLVRLLVQGDARQLAHLVGQELQQVVHADDAGQRARLGHHRHPADAPKAHPLDGFVDVVALLGQQQVVAHHVAHLQAGRIERQRDHGDDDVAIGENAHRHALAVRLVDHDQVADMVLAHQ